MKVRVTIQETKVIERTYEVNGVNSLESAAKCAERCMRHAFQPNTYLWQQVPRPPSYKVCEYEIVES